MGKLSFLSDPCSANPLQQNCASFATSLGSGKPQPQPNILNNPQNQVTK